MKNALRAMLGGLSMLVVGACSDPPPPVEPPAPAPEPEPPPPPPEPTCEAMKDHCKAEADTVVPIPQVSLGFTPPLGWEYAMLEEASVTQMSDEGPVLVLASLKPDAQAYKLTAQRTALVTSLAELVDIEPPSKITFSQPNKRKFSEMTMMLWENEAKRANKKGALLLLATTVGEREIFGIGFAAAGDLDGTKAILETLNTFKAVEPEEGAGTDDTGDDEGGGKDGKKQ